MTKKNILKFDHSIFRLVIRNIQGYGTFQVPLKGTKRATNICPQLDQLKKRILDKLIQKQSRRSVKLINWVIAWEVHRGSGLPHLDMLLVFERNVQFVSTAFDYLIKDLKIQQKDVGDKVGVGHVWVTPYSSKKFNKAILEYGWKQDPDVISNIDEISKFQIIKNNEFKADPYRYLQLQMLKDPLHFNLEEYVRKHDLMRYITNWSSLKVKLKDMQIAAANLELKAKPGLSPITRELIQNNLTDSELLEYDSWDGYQIIVDCINQLIKKPNYDRTTANPMHTKHLLITGFHSGIGKTSLVEHDVVRDSKYNYPGLQHYYSTYKLKVAESYFPPYRSHNYSLVYWDQFKIDSKLFSKKNYDFLLSYLGGSQCLLPVKYSIPVRRQDHPFHIMTSNYSLQEHIQVTFDSERARNQVKSNLKDRLIQVRIPSGKNIHFLRKLFILKNSANLKN